MNHIFASHAKHSTYTHTLAHIFIQCSEHKSKNQITKHCILAYKLYREKKETIKHHINNKRTIRIALLYSFNQEDFLLGYIRAIQTLRYCSAHALTTREKKIERIRMCNLYNQTQPQCLLVKFEQLEFQAQKSELNSFETM